MKTEEYQKKSIRTLNRLSTIEQDITHMKLGLITEIGELADVYKRFIAYGKEIDLVNVKEEVGDLLWYNSNLANIIGIDICYFEELFQKKRNNECLNSSSEYMILTMSMKIGGMAMESGPTEFDLFSLYYSIRFFCIKNDIDIEECMQKNYDKLFKRFPEKFTNENALNRNLDEERKELEK